jgi:hypothetical protein
MTFTSYLSKFSLPELFQFIEEGYKSGLLTVRSLDQNNEQTTDTYYIWSQQGRIIAAADRLDNQGLFNIITQRGWIDLAIAKKIFPTNNNYAIGLYLKSRQFLQSEQLTLLFRSQLTTYLSPLFQLSDAHFEFTPQVTLPYAEMTGLSIPATEATLTGLRTLRDWSNLENKLPDINSSLVKNITNKPKFRLEYSECQVWEYAKGELSLREIAQAIAIPEDKVQQIAFRLILTNLVEERLVMRTSIHSNPQNIFQDESCEFADLNSTNRFGESNTKDFSLTSSREFKSHENQYSVNSNHSISKGNKTSEPVLDSVPQPAISQSFLQNLFGFLKSKTAE